MFRFERGLLAPVKAYGIRLHKDHFTVNQVAHFAALPAYNWRNKKALLGHEIMTTHVDQNPDNFRKLYDRLGKAPTIAVARGKLDHQTLVMASHDIIIACRMNDELFTMCRQMLEDDRWLKISWLDKSISPLDSILMKRYMSLASLQGSLTGAMPLNPSRSLPREYLSCRLPQKRAGVRFHGYRDRTVDEPAYHEAHAMLGIFLAMDTLRLRQHPRPELPISTTATPRI